MNITRRRPVVAPSLATEMAFDRYFKFVNFVSYGRFDTMMRGYFLMTSAAESILQAPMRRRKWHTDSI